MNNASCAGEDIYTGDCLQQSMAKLTSPRPHYHTLDDVVYIATPSYLTMDGVDDVHKVYDVSDADDMDGVDDVAHIPAPSLLHILAGDWTNHGENTARFT